MQIPIKDAAKAIAKKWTSVKSNNTEPNPVAKAIIKLILILNNTPIFRNKQYVKISKINADKKDIELISVLLFWNIRAVCSGDPDK